MLTVDRPPAPPSMPPSPALAPPPQQPGWTLVAADAFGTDGVTHGWSSNVELLFGDCGEIGPMLGGLGTAFGAGAYVEKTFSLLGADDAPPAHSLVRVEVDMVKVGTWDGEEVRVDLDGEIATTRSTHQSDGRVAYCGRFGPSGEGEVEEDADGATTLSAQIDSAAAHVHVRISTTLDESAANEAWGVQRVRVLVSMGPPSAPPHPPHPPPSYPPPSFPSPPAGPPPSLPLPLRPPSPPCPVAPPPRPPFAPGMAPPPLCHCFDTCTVHYEPSYTYSYSYAGWTWMASPDDWCWGCRIDVASDGVCDDGGPGYLPGYSTSRYPSHGQVCALGTDCADCGPRCPPPPPAPVSPPPRAPPSTPPSTPPPFRFTTASLAESVAEWLANRNATEAVLGPIGQWETSGVTSLEGLFSNAEGFNEDISGWDTSAVTSMRDTFLGALSFNADVGGWDVARVVDFRRTFLLAQSFSQDLSRWNVTRAASLVFGMFRHASAFDANLERWDVASVENFKFMFEHSGMSNCSLARVDRSYSARNVHWVVLAPDHFGDDTFLSQCDEPPPEPPPPPSAPPPSAPPSLPPSSPPAPPAQWALTNIELRHGVMTKVSGNHLEYDAHAVSSGFVTQVAMSAPVRDTTSEKYFRMCLTSDPQDSVSCRSGVMVGKWPWGAVYTMCAGWDGRYESDASEGDELALAVESASQVTVRRNGLLMRTCTLGTNNDRLYAKLFIYAKGSSLNEPILQNLTLPTPESSPSAESSPSPESSPTPESSPSPESSPTPEPPSVSIVVTAFSASGDVSDYDQARQDGIKIAVATEAGVAVTAVSLDISPGSVIITATIAVPAGLASSSVGALSAGMFSSPGALQTALGSTGVLGITIEAIQTAPSIVSSLSADGEASPLPEGCVAARPAIILTCELTAEQSDRRCSCRLVWNVDCPHPSGREVLCI